MFEQYKCDIGVIQNYFIYVNPLSQQRRYDYMVVITTMARVFWRVKNLKINKNI